MSVKTVGILFWLTIIGLASAALIWQLKHPLRAAAVVNPTQGPPELPVVTPLQPFRLAPSASYEEIDSRPLFIMARRPEPPIPEEPAEPEKPPATGPEKKFVLLGVAISPNVTTVLLRPEEPNAKTRRVKLGETVEGWLLEKVSPNQVVLRQGQTTRELNLARQRKPARGRTVGRTGVGSEQNAPPPAAGVPVAPPSAGTPQTTPPAPPPPQ